MGYRCLFCYTEIKEDRILIKSENIGLKNSSSPVLEGQLKVIFILRKLLEIPEVKLISFLEDWGNNPSEWIRLCEQCEESVENARKIYVEILEVQRRFRGVQQRIVEVTKRSCYGDIGGERGKCERRAISEDSIVTVTNECRAVIQDRTDQCCVPEDNPFIEGDLMAETAVIAGERTVSIVDNVNITAAPVKEEVIFEDESESILPSDHFDDSSTEVPADMETNYENDEDDDDDEWVPDPLESISPKRKSARSRSKVIPKPKLRRKILDKNGRPTLTIECPVCQNFKCKVNEGVELCEHLEFCTEKFENQDEDFNLNCPVCSEFTVAIGNKVEFSEHMSWCDAINQNSGAELEEHESSLLRWKIFSCETCGKKGKTKFMNFDQFLDHLIHHMRCPFKCTRCPQRFKTGTSQYNFYHYKVNHPNFLQPVTSRCIFDDDLPTYFWWCPVSKCSEKFTTHNLRDDHIQLAHAASCKDIQSRKSVICGMCSSAFFCADELRLHNATNHVFMEQVQERSVQNQEQKTPKQKVIERKGSDLVPKKPRGWKPRPSSQPTTTKPPSSKGPIVPTTNPVVTLSSTDFFTKLQFRQFLKKRFIQLNHESELSKQSNNRLFSCNICSDREVMDLAAFLNHYLFHKRNIFKCTKCSHRFPSDESQDTKYHYKTVHPEHENESPGSRCVEDAVLPELIWVCFHCKEEYSSEHLRDSHVETEHQDKLMKEKSELCQFCSKKYITSEELLIHTGTTHVIVQKFRKDRILSPSEFFTKLQFKEILKKHFTKQNRAEFSKSDYNRLFLCNICPDRTAMDLAAFLDHYLFHRRKIFKCTKCSHRFPSNESQDTGYHFRKVHPEHFNEPVSKRCVEDVVLPELIWVCFHCKDEYSSENLRDSHVETEHQDKLFQEKSHMCQLCPKKYSSREELLIHIGTTHVLVEKQRNDKRFKCSECLENFEKWSDYENHCRKVHEKGNINDNVDEGNGNLAQAVRVICDVCGKLIKHTYLKEHLRLHKRTKKFHCLVPGCGESFTTNEYLGLHKFRKHESRDAGKNPLVCPYCPAGEKVLHNRAYLRKHIKAVHHKKFDVQCHMCGKGFISKSHLTRHMSAAHQVVSEGLHKCPLEGCGKIFYWKGALQDHLSKHNGQPKFSCHICRKEFYFNKYLRRHELIHKNAESKPYQCEICSKRFPVRNYLYIHMKSHRRKGEVQ